MCVKTVSPVNQAFVSAAGCKSGFELPSSDVLCVFPLRSLYRTGWFGTVVEYGAERKISRHSVLSATVSVGVPQGVTLKIKYWPSQNVLLLSCSLSSLPLLMRLCARGCALQVGACQSDVPVPHTPDGPAAAQCRLLRHGGTAADLLGRPQAGHCPIHQSTEGRVSAPRFHLPF